jgi:hypothetical protein
MNNASNRQHPAFSSSEKRSVKTLSEKMGVSNKELREINNKYGVSAAKLLELMQLSKYQFVYSDKTPGQCEPCQNAMGKLKVVNF